jgi:Anti-sigma factor NepR
MLHSLEDSMVKANRTNGYRSTSVSPSDAPSGEDESRAKLAARRDDNSYKPLGGRFGSPLHRETAAPGCRSTGTGKASVGEYIGRELRELYDDVLAQPVPDRFLSLLNKLDAGAISAAQAAGRRGDMD